MGRHMKSGMLIIKFTGFNLPENLKSRIAAPCRRNRELWQRKRCYTGKDMICGSCMVITIFHRAINGHLALPIGHLQPVLRRTRHLNSKADNTIHTSKDCYKYSFFPRTIKDWNSLPDKLATIKEPHKFKLALPHFD